MLGGFFMSINIENMEKPKCAKIFWQMQKQFWLTTMMDNIYNKDFKSVSLRQSLKELIINRSSYKNNKWDMLRQSEH